MKLAKGDRIAELKLPNTKGGQFDIESLKGKKSLLTFYRFAQCPFCNLRVNEFVKRYPEFKDNLNVEVQVDPEFINHKDAENVALKYCKPVGQLPTSLRSNVETMWIHRGMKAFGGGNKNILIHTDWSEMHYENQGILEEALFHEATHTSLDDIFSNDENWLNAQNEDCNFISTYAFENPQREDVAESFLPFFAIKIFPNRISSAMKKTIIETMPARIKYFDDKILNYYPFIRK